MKKISIFIAALATGTALFGTPLKEGPLCSPFTERPSVYIHTGAVSAVSDIPAGLSTQLGIGVRGPNEHTYDVAYTHVHHTLSHSHHLRALYLYQGDEFGGIYFGAGVQGGVSILEETNVTPINRRWSSEWKETHKLFLEVPVLLGYKFQIGKQNTFVEATFSTDKALSFCTGVFF